MYPKVQPSVTEARKRSMIWLRTLLIAVSVCLCSCIGMPYFFNTGRSAQESTSEQLRRNTSTPDTEGIGEVQITSITEATTPASTPTAQSTMHSLIKWG